MTIAYDINLAMYVLHIRNWLLMTEGQPEAVARRCSVKNVFLKISQNSQEKTCAKVSFLIKLQGLQL